MTYLEIIQLVKNKAPADLTLEEADAVRAKLQESPQLYAALGGREKVEEYLAGLPTADDVPTAEPQEDQEDAVALTADPGAADVTEARGRRWPLPVACLVLSLAGAYWIYSIQNRAQENAVVDADGKLDAATDVTDDVDHAAGPADHPADSSDRTATAAANKERLWKGWTYTGDEGAEHTVVSDWDISQPENPIATMSFVTGRRRVVLSQERELAASEGWLRMRFRYLTRSPQAGAVEVRADGRPIARFDFPMFGEGAEYAVPLAGLQGRAQFEVIIRPGDENERISWWTIRFADSVQSPHGDIVVVPRLGDATASVAAETETDRGLENVVQLIPSPYAIFEDEGEIAATDSSATGSATLVTEHAYTGAAAIRVTPDGPLRRELPQKIVISKQPGPGEFRYLRFAVRVHGGGRTALALDHTAAAEMPVSYDLGEGDPAFAKAYRIHVVPAHDGWVVVTRDLFRDFGSVEITGLMLSKLDGGHALFDHVYLARSRSQFDRAPQPADPSLVRHVTPPEPVGPASENLAQTVVAIRLDHRLATGVIVSEDGFVFTTAEMVVQGAKEIVVYLWDGSSAPAEIIATRRDFNVGLLKISDQGHYYPYAKMAEASNVGARRDYRAFSHYYSFRPGAAPEEIFVPSTTPFFGYAKVGNVQHQFAVGGPVFDPEGQVIGIHIGSERGAMRYREIEYFTMYWDQLAAGESGG